LLMSSDTIADSGLPRVLTNAYGRRVEKAMLMAPRSSGCSGWSDCPNKPSCPISCMLRLPPLSRVVTAEAG
jgi:hypothetical protein